MLVVFSATLMLVDLFVSVMKVTVSVAIMQLEVPATLMQVKVSAAVMQVVFSTVHYAHEYFYCNYAGGCLVVAMYVTQIHGGTLYSFL